MLDEVAVEFNQAFPKPRGFVGVSCKAASHAIQGDFKNGIRLGKHRNFLG